MANFLARNLLFVKNFVSGTIPTHTKTNSPTHTKKINKVILRRKNPGFANSNPKNPPIQN
jgi:hypothetical protein